MRIKEVEKETGLTAKAIRLYESKGLLCVARESENDYREYTPEDVERLKTIAVLRKLDVPIKEIKQWCDGAVSVSDLLHRQSGEAMLASQQMDERLELTQELMKILDQEPEKTLYQAIEEAQELRELYQAIEEAREQLRGDLFSPVFATLIALGPVGWTVVRILMGQTETALLSFGISLLVVPYVCYRWYRYFGVERRKRKIGCLLLIPAVILAIVFAWGSMFFVLMCQEQLFLPEEGWYLSRWAYAALLYPMLVILSFTEDRMEPDPEEKKEPEETPQEKRRNKIRLWCVILAFHLLLYYGCITACTTYSDGVFIRHSFFCPAGKTYTLADVAQVEAGFYGRWTWHPWKESGDFYYKITYSDGVTENWTDLNMTFSEDNADPWLELQELDQILMDADVKKVANWENRELFAYDPACLEICDAILGNQ